MSSLVRILGLVFFWAFCVGAKSLSLALDWFENPLHAPLFVAQENHFFEKHGLKLRWFTPSHPEDALLLVLSHKVDVALTYQPAFTVARERGYPLKYVGSLVAQPLAALLVRGDNLKIKDLANKKIGYSYGATGSSTTRTMLIHEGVAPNQVHWVAVKYGLMQALMSGKVDAVAGVMRCVEPVELDARKFKYRMFFPENYGVPKYHELIFVGHVELSDAKKQAFLTAVQEGIEELRRDPEKYWNSFAQQHPEMSDTMHHTMWKKTIPVFARKVDALDTKDFERFRAFLKASRRCSLG